MKLLPALEKYKPDSNLDKRRLKHQNQFCFYFPPPDIWHLNSLHASSVNKLQLFSAVMSIFLSSLRHRSSSNCSGSVKASWKVPIRLWTKSLADWSPEKKAVTVASKIARLTRDNKSESLRTPQQG